MSDKKNIGLQIEKIKIVFQTAKDICAEQEDFNNVLKHLENVAPEFLSIAYEGASMALALKDFSKGNELKQWSAFMKGPGVNHSAQIHAGLGWAIAQQNNSPLQFLEMINPLMRARVLDGCGYYDGIFKQRQTIKNNKPPNDLQGPMLEAYDQGVGRSIWYICKGEVEQVLEIINTFPPTRHPALWRGIGVACAYVGGCDEHLLRLLLFSSQDYQKQLCAGAILAARGRVQANALTQDVELVCRIWCNLSIQEAMLLTVRTEPSSSVDPNNAYSLWLSQIEAELIPSDLNTQIIQK
jgi:hypothetical protein